jgi:hypothetical protein
VGAALQALEITVIYALSPQAKGRVERLWGTLQDRLVSELRLAGVRTAVEANAVLLRYTPEHNRLFAVAAAEVQLAWRPIRRGIDLERICSFRYLATVLNDNTVRLGGMVIDVPPGLSNRHYASAHVEVEEMVGRSWRRHRGATVIATAARQDRRAGAPPAAAPAAGA